jgi:hypothetical protein
MYLFTNVGILKHLMLDMWFCFCSYAFTPTLFTCVISLFVAVLGKCVPRFSKRYDNIAKASY